MIPKYRICIPKRLEPVFNGLADHQDKNTCPLVLFDPETGTSNNCLIFGSPGSGTTYAMQFLAMRLTRGGGKACIVSTEKGSILHKVLCGQLSGTYIQLGAPSKTCLNPMDLRTELPGIRHWEESHSEQAFPLLKTKARKLITFYSLLNPLTQDEERTLETAVLDTFQRFGFELCYETPDSARGAIQHNSFPTLQDLDDTLSRLAKTNPHTKTLRIITTILTRGSLNCFNGQTNIALNASLAVLDVSELICEVRSAATFAVLDFAQSIYLEDNATPNAILLEQLACLIGDTSSTLSSQYALDLFRTAQSTTTSIIATIKDIHEFHDLLNDEFVQSFIDCTNYHYIQRHDRYEMPLLTKTLNLDDCTASKIPDLMLNNGILHCENRFVFTMLQATPEEHRILNTDPTHLAAPCT